MVDFTKNEIEKKNNDIIFDKWIISHKKLLLFMISSLFIFIIFIYIPYRPGFLKVKVTPDQIAMLSRKIDNMDANFVKLFKWTTMQDSLNKETRMIMQRVPKIFPVPGARITSNYGMRDSVMHWGVDIAQKTGSPIYAPASGKVITAKYSDGYGNLTIIDTGIFLVKIGHQDKMYVTPGQEVNQGQLIGTVGNTGYSFGAHEHIEIIQDGKHRDPIKFYQ